MSAPPSAPGLQRRLGLWSSVAVLIGITIGSGIFRSPAGIAAKLPGPLPLMGVWIAGGIVALCGALSLAEIASVYPKTGGIYAYLRECWGRLPAFLFGWAEFVIIRAAAIGAISLTFAEYSLRVFLPNADIGQAPYSDWSHWLAAVAIIVTSVFNIVGIRWGSLIQNITTVAKYAGLLIIAVMAIAIGLPRTGGHFTPAAPVGSFSFGAFGLALVSVLWAFDGWADVSFVGGEIKDPQKNLPKALLIGTTAVIAIYLLANLAYLMVFPVEQIAKSRLVAADVAQALVGAWGVTMVGLTVMLSTFGSLNGTMLASPRIFFAMADDGLFFKQVAKVHPTYHTPWVAIGLSCALGVGFVLLRSFEQLADAFVTAIVPFYMLAIAGIFVLRRRPDHAPAFRTPWYPVAPIIFLLSTTFLIVTSLLDDATRGPALAVFGAIAVGVPVFYLMFNKSGRA
jgi:basic amino acid/polyamine antiporter, APA family